MIFIMREISMELKDSKIICVVLCFVIGKNVIVYIIVLVISIYRVMKYIYINIFFFLKLYICLLIIKLFNLECVFNKLIFKLV